MVLFVFSTHVTPAGREKKKNNNKTSVFQAGKIPRVESLKREEKK